MSYIRFQQRSGKRVAPATINHRLTTASCLYRYYTQREIPSVGRAPKARPFSFRSDPSEQAVSSNRRRTGTQLRVKAPRSVVVPLTSKEVQTFLEGLRTWRDLSLVALMLFCGLRSFEVLSITLEDVRMLEEQLVVNGKGRKTRVV
ncbi:MAG: tyrosine-type recombinase/integrase, partial [Nitrospira sp.]